MEFSIEDQVFYVALHPQENQHLGYFIGKGWIGPNICHLCKEEPNTVEHLFKECSFGRDFISDVTSHFDIGIAWDDCSLVDFLENWLKS